MTAGVFSRDWTLQHSVKEHLARCAVYAKIDKSNKVTDGVCPSDNDM